ncbi:type 4 prepilin peptidase 1 [Paenibacillus sp. J23TS9]|uniref:A24 family peptidase n=1 Tax=Paenibacillus sp. J23TS9 TaxID=2807193 RepID=UPI001B28345B|nr:prepilin peptidase [Paenibacillus sp. J23TS9]GIP29471.1 type 4 prepilin peptidase 1 [Paenibacillus sp. J23TS9]
MDVSIWGCTLIIMAAFVTDIRTMKIPNWLTITAMFSGVLFHVITGGLQGVAFSAKGLGAGFGLLLIMHVIGAVGAGDVKLFGGIGAWMGTLLTVQCLVYSVLCAGVIGVMILLWRRETVKRLRKVVSSLTGVFILRSFQALKTGKEKQLRFPFMLAVVPGYIFACIYTLI